MTTISGTVSSSPQAPASLQSPSAGTAAQSANIATSGSGNSASSLVISGSASYSDASQAIVNNILDQQDSATAAQKPAGGAAASGGGASSSSTKTLTEAEPDGEEIALTEDAKGKVISEKIIKAASQPDTSTAERA